MKAKTALVSLCGLIPTPVMGFGADDASRPSPPPEARAGERAIRDEGAVKAGEDQVLLPALHGVALAATADAALDLQQETRAGIRLAGIPEPGSIKIQEVVGRYLGQPVSLRTLERLSEELETAFRMPGETFMQVSYPEQEITSGVIAIRVCPARAGQVLLSGKPAFGAKFAAEGFRTRSGEAISADVIAGDLDWLNENPLRRASISCRDGSAPDLLDLTIQVRAAKTWRAYGGIDNQLSAQLGDERLFLGFQHGDLFSLDHRLTAQFTSALDTKSLHGVSGVYEIPLLPWRHLLELSAGYTESESAADGPLDQSGRFSRMALGYRVPLPRWGGIRQEWRMGMEFRNNDYQFSNGSSEVVNFFQIESGWKGRLADRMGVTRVDLSLHYSPGQGILGSDDKDFIALGADGAESWIARLEGERTLKVGGMGTLAGRVQAQWADSDLLSSDQISAGGVNRVRGFDEAVGYASRGVIGSIELQSPAFKTDQAGEFQGICFVDAALLHRDHAVDAGELASAGVGLRWRFEDRLTARCDLGIPIEGPDSETGNPLLHFSISTSW